MRKSILKSCWWCARSTCVILLFFSQVARAQSNDLPAQIKRGKLVYDQLCLACHQADATGVPNLNPPLIKTSQVLGDKKALIRIVLMGLDKEIEVNGDYYENVMPPLAYLSDEEIADVLTYVRNSFGNRADAVSATTVKAIREESK
jgi:mono/diheme cytochrome c family protein